MFYDFITMVFWTKLWLPCFFFTARLLLSTSRTIQMCHVFEHNMLYPYKRNANCLLCLWKGNLISLLASSDRGNDNWLIKYEKPGDGELTEKVSWGIFIELLCWAAQRKWHDWEPCACCNGSRQMQGCHIPIFHMPNDHVWIYVWIYVWI